MTDHTLLTQTATWAEVKALCADGIRFKTASVCVPPCFVKQAAEFAAGAVPVCTVVGFPNGYSTTAAKIFETADAVKNGAEEIDMVINLALVREGRFDEAGWEIEAVRNACAGRVLKVIVETCLLTGEEKKRLCAVVSQAGADYIKTSTGFSAGGAKAEDVALFKACKPERLKIKASGGISSFEDAERLVAAGADRLGTSRLIKIAKEAEHD